MAVVNKYYSLEGKVNCLYDILRSIAIDESRLSDNNRLLYHDIRNQEAK